ncbi:hypothetical protein M378DRAFT_335299 [Amanita muscaria Koide BX008]|uniref:GATA-type domain-containing protein n=1 Tax=Amanita muscaria (strain Koide BX008) TaxID=946122 RepID=A0A0C2SW05_AMAMK|nr:hypothetical protein M378DRAFT_335299 [Amanita muscaria Koide BX008]
MSWRLWHLQNLMVDTDNAKSKRDFKKLSKCMGDKLDKEKGRRSIEELEAPDYRHNHSAEYIRQKAAEKERSREASQNPKTGIIKRMQFTFSVDQPSPATNQPVQKPDLRPSLEFPKRTRSARNTDETTTAAGESSGKNLSATPAATESVSQSLRFPPLFSNDFGPSALLYSTPTVTNSMNYGEGLSLSSTFNDGFSILRPTIELPLDEILNNVDDTASFPFSIDHPNTAAIITPTSYATQTTSPLPQRQEDVVMQPVNIPPPPTVATETRKTRRRASAAARLVAERHENDTNVRVSAKSLGNNNASSLSPSQRKEGNELSNALSQVNKEAISETVVPTKVNLLLGSAQSNHLYSVSPRPALTVKTQSTARNSGLAATATNSTTRSTNTGNNTASGGVKAECSNCGATHTPLWRRGLNDELNCNACGLYCKLHKRPRPKSMRNSHGEGRVQVAPRQETVDVMAQCYNCHTTATPLWRKDDEGKTVCNACGLYYKLHGSARPISMKSDVIRKRSRHDARRGGNPSETPSASPGVSRRPSPARDASPTLAPDSTTQMSYDYPEDVDYRSAQSELLGALGSDTNQPGLFSSSFQFRFPGPYHPDYLLQHYSLPSDPLPFSNLDNHNSSGNSSDVDIAMSPRSPKRRRMSTDSTSEPPSSAASYSSFDNFSNASSVTSNSARSSVDFPFSNYSSCNGGSSSPNAQSNTANNGSDSNGAGIRDSGSTFWHPPMILHNDRSPALFHPPMLPPTDDSPMDYLHPPMVLPDDVAETLFSTYLHPPMALPDENSAKSGSSGGRSDSGGLESFDTPMRVY